MVYMHHSANLPLNLIDLVFIWDGAEGDNIETICLK